jgi:hypothetical protein
MKPNLISGIARWSADTVGRLQDDAGIERQLVRRRVDSGQPFQTSHCLGKQSTPRRSTVASRTPPPFEIRQATTRRFDSCFDTQNHIRSAYQNTSLLNGVKTFAYAQ